MPFQLIPVLLPISVLCLLLPYVALRYVRKPKLSYPPGPPPKLLVGNAFDIPSEKAWLKYIRWSEEFNSDMIHLSVMNTHIVVLHAMEDIIELMDRRSGNYSSRPANPLFKLLGQENIVTLLPYGDAMKKQRKMLDSCLRKDVIPSYYHVQTEKAHLFLGQLLLNPDGFKAHCKWLGSSITTAIAFGYDVIPGRKGDRFVDPAEFVSHTAAVLLTPGKTLITLFPLLRHIPPWFPGASTQRLAAQVREAAAQYRIESFEFVKRNMAAGMSQDSLLKRILERHQRDDGSFEDEETIMDAVSGLYFGGVETAQIVQAVFIMAMALHPEKQKLAQDEIDMAVGSDGLPSFADRPSLPYVDALLREVLRWRPVTPLGFAHSTLEDDIYKGYHIPKGTIILPNVWAITRNEAVYPNPEAFKPERFLKADGSLTDDTVSYAFGFGRRICIGRHMADAVLWIMMASVLATFNISKARDGSGNEIDIDADAFAGGVTVHPLPFKCSIVPRSQQAESLIRNAASVAWQDMRKSDEETAMDAS